MDYLLRFTWVVALLLLLSCLIWLLLLILLLYLFTDWDLPVFTWCLSLRFFWITSSYNSSKQQRFGFLNIETDGLSFNQVSSGIFFCGGTFLSSPFSTYQTLFSARPHPPLPLCCLSSFLSDNEMFYFHSALFSFPICHGYPLPCMQCTQYTPSVHSDPTALSACRHTSLTQGIQSKQGAEEETGNEISALGRGKIRAVFL